MPCDSDQKRKSTALIILDRIYFKTINVSTDKEDSLIETKTKTCQNFIGNVLHLYINQEDLVFNYIDSINFIES